MTGHEYSIWGWAKNKGTLGDSAALKAFLVHLTGAIEMQPLWAKGIDIEVEIYKLERTPAEDEGGASASCIISTSHATIHGWPQHDPEADDGGYFILQVCSCRDFDKNLVMKLARGVLGATRIDSRTCLMTPPPLTPEPEL
jgi:S-adenosylmethionine/arginine decarboxylase-like enzyme